MSLRFLILLCVAFGAQALPTNDGKIEDASLTDLESWSPHHSKEAAASAKQTSYAGYLKCYENFNYGGDSVYLIWNTPELRSYYFDNWARSCCVYGIWVLYDYENYNPNGGASTWLWGEDFCTNLEDISINMHFADIMSSARFAGPQDGYRQDMITFYEHEGFGGIQQRYWNDAIQLNYDNMGKSIIITGCSYWTVYQYEDYGGDSVCFYPGDPYNCYPAFYPTKASLGIIANKMSSVRKGCYGFRKVALRNGEVVDVSHEGRIDTVGARKAFVPVLEGSKDNNPVHAGSYTPAKDELNDPTKYLMDQESE